MAKGKAKKRAKKYVPFTVDRQKKRITYNINPDSGQFRYIKKIYLYGFTALPPGLSQKGFGFTGSPFYLLGELDRNLPKRFEFHIHRTGKARIQSLATKLKLHLEYSELNSVLRQLKEFRAERNKKSNNLVLGYLNSHFPRYFSKPTAKYDAAYKKDQLAGILGKQKIIANLSKTDIESLTDFFPRFLKSHSETLSATKRLLATRATKNTTESIYLRNVIKDFERRLKLPSQSEQRWQDFLRENILLFNTNYTSLIEKENISLSGDYPDFLLVNVYDYLDIYEIKKPSTALLNRDTSRNNYYWTAEIAKAISQVENYVEELQRHKDAFINEVRDKLNIRIRVIKPRGYIIAGTSSQLKSASKEDNFKLLNSSLKNIEIVLYDDFLKNLKNLLARLV